MCRRGCVSNEMYSYFYCIGLNPFYFRDPIQCGDLIRLEHLLTKKNLHSHLFSAPLSHGQEVSAFGKDGDGDTGIVVQSKFTFCSLNN